MRRTAQGLGSAEKPVMWNFAMSEPKHFTVSLNFFKENINANL